MPWVTLSTSWAKRRFRISVKLSKITVIPTYILVLFLYLKLLLHNFVIWQDDMFINVINWRQHRTLFPVLLQWCSLHGFSFFLSKVQLIPFFLLFSHLLTFLVVTGALNCIGFFLHLACSGLTSWAFGGCKYFFSPLLSCLTVSQIAFAMLFLQRKQRNFVSEQS